MAPDTDSFYGRGTLLFFATLTNTFLGAFEGVQLWSHRPLIEKHRRYGFYCPSSEAVASMIADLPNKVLLTTAFNVPFYFLANLRRTPAAFCTMYLYSFCGLLTGSTLFRAIGAISRTTGGSIAPGATFILLLVIYTGFVLPIPNMPPWLGWFRYLNPMSYILESLIINEFKDRSFVCAAHIPGTTICASVSAETDRLAVSGNSYIIKTFAYQISHMWSNLGWTLLIMVALCTIYLLATEHVTMRLQNQLFIDQRRISLSHTPGSDIETQMSGKPETKLRYPSSSQSPADMSSEQIDGAFLWRHIICEIKSSESSKRSLDDCSGWIVPGTLTALMGASGAGKTTLLNILAERPSVGVISGSSMTKSTNQNKTFARRVGYAQQQDLHLPTMTVREAFVFSALLRQPSTLSREKKLQLVDEVIESLDMTALQHTIIGPVGGRGLNVEQQKRVTIGVELVARPDLLLFLDEPTSGLDSNTAWSICRLLRRLCDDGQTILCTIHQPSATLLQMFDRLLLLQEGKTIYFGEIGPSISTLTTYFERFAARPCGRSENPAEWMLEVIDDHQWPWSEHWLSSKEYRASERYLDKLQVQLSSQPTYDAGELFAMEFASSFSTQLRVVTARNFHHDWRTPSYLAAKIFLTIGSVSSTANIHMVQMD
jgi:ABC-type multidrug transport system ATPase subunit/ABC-type multidrug transport system permease subunit